MPFIEISRLPPRQSKPVKVDLKCLCISYIHIFSSASFHYIGKSTRPVHMCFGVAQHRDNTRVIELSYTRLCASSRVQSHCHVCLIVFQDRENWALYIHIYVHIFIYIQISTQ